MTGLFRLTSALAPPLSRPLRAVTQRRRHSVRCLSGFTQRSAEVPTGRSIFFLPQNEYTKNIRQYLARVKSNKGKTTFGVLARGFNRLDMIGKVVGVAHAHTRPSERLYSGQSSCSGCTLGLFFRLLYESNTFPSNIPPNDMAVSVSGNECCFKAAAGAPVIRDFHMTC